MKLNNNKQAKKYIIFLGVIILITVMIIPSLSSCKLFNKDKSSDDAKSKEGSKKEESSENTGSEFGPVFDLGEIIINLADAGQVRYAKMSVAIELDNETTLAEAQRRDPQIRDTVIELISKETAEKILSPDSRKDLKNEIMDNINKNLSEGEVTSVYFTTILVQ
jgi:flagellar FliL protein